MSYAIEFEGEFVDWWRVDRDCDIHNVVLKPNGTFTWKFRYFDDEPGNKTCQEWRLKGEYNLLWLIHNLHYCKI